VTLHWAVLVLASFAAALALHRLACRLPVNMDRVSRFLLAGGIAGACLLWATSARYGLASVETAGAALVYAFLCELYIFLFTMTISSISSNLLVRLSSHDMRVEEIAQRYDSRQMVRQRLERLASTGFLSQTGSRLALTAKGVRFVRTFGALRRFFRQA
jgi:hypothetical protein